MPTVPRPFLFLGYMAEGFGCVGLWGFRGIRVRSQEALGACVYRFDL